MSSLFEAEINRQNTKSAKWDLVKHLYGSEDVLPMWVADMDLKVPEVVTKALQDRVDHGIFGYTLIDTSVKESVSNWVNTMHHWKINKSWLQFSPGVITTLHMAVQTFTNEQDNILIQTPVYPPFYQIIETHNRKVVKNPLLFVNGKYEIDFDDMEQKMQQGIKAFILCNPHNPVGRVWSKEELIKIIELCKKYHVLILSDEIHADLVYPSYQHIPIASLDDEIRDKTITCMSPTKTFNLAGLQASYAVVPNKEMREQLDQMFQKQGIHGINTMGIAALEAAYTDGAEWLASLKDHLLKNATMIKDMLKDCEEITMIEPEGTYLIWLDFRKLGFTQEELKELLQKEAKVGLNDGVSFGIEGTGFMRVNIATTSERVKEGMSRIIHAVKNR
ncbi:MalY/PatB family protein [Gracilibacillus marinus]|uniref:cysteine-S-conjugate beta-lyase n=1 Tax=Gracilibacillus marinus TaxID=630535 RepID=A0ABV8VRW3_9BACI